MGQAFGKFFEWLFAAVGAVIQPVADAIASFFAGLLAKMQFLVPLALDFGGVVTLLIFVIAPLFVTYWLMRVVSGSTKRSMGQTDAVVTSAMFAVAASGGLGSMFGAALSIGGIAIALITVWTILTAVGFVFGCRPNIGTFASLWIAGGILLLSVCLGLTVYAV